MRHYYGKGCAWVSCNMRSCELNRKTVDELWNQTKWAKLKNKSNIVSGCGAHIRLGKWYACNRGFIHNSKGLLLANSQIQQACIEKNIMGLKWEITLALKIWQREKSDYGKVKQKWLPLEECQSLMHSNRILTQLMDVKWFVKRWPCCRASQCVWVSVFVGQKMRERSSIEVLKDSFVITRRNHSNYEISFISDVPL